MDARTIKRVDVEAARKVTADTMPVCALIPEGILHTTSAVLGPTMSLVGISKQLPFSPSPSMLHLMNSQRERLQTVSKQLYDCSFCYCCCDDTAVSYSLQHFTISFHLLDIEHAMEGLHWFPVCVPTRERHQHSCESQQLTDWKEQKAVPNLNLQRQLHR